MVEDFGKHVEWLIGQVGSFRRLLPPFRFASAKLTERVDSDLDEFVEKHANVVERDDDGGIRKFSIPIGYNGRFKFLRQRHYDSVTFTKRLPRMALVSLVSTFDAYLGRLVRTLYSVQPEVLTASDKSLTLAELAEFESLEDARSHVVEEEVEDLLRQSHSKQFSWLENKLGIPLRKDLDTWSGFVEATERRNLFVHTDGVVSKQYLGVCSKEGCENLEEICVGDQLNVTPDYFEHACDCVCDISVKLSQVMWRKLCPDDVENADNALISASYEFLLTKEYKVAESILRFSTKKPIKTASKEGELYLLINLGISLKGQERSDGEFNYEARRLIDWNNTSVGVLNPSTLRGRSLSLFSMT